MSTQISLKAAVPEQLAGNRLDQIAAKLFPDYSRAKLQDWIKAGSLLVNEKQLRPRDRLQTGDMLVVETELAYSEEWQPEAMPLDIVFEDEHLLVINKPLNVVVHPAAGNREHTLLNGLLHYCPDLAELPRAGIVHRLDKDTTGLMVVAKSLESHTDLGRQLQAREVVREYEAIVQGFLTGGGTIDAPLGRHPVSRKKRAVVQSGQQAVTHYRVITRFRSHTHVRVKLETGRTHQIRVHMAHIKHPIIGDPVYGGRLQLPAACSEELAESLKNFRRQALHACRLQLSHPLLHTPLAWESVRPEDMEQLLKSLSADQHLARA
ncbi:MAG: 23S rRNA pseudouridine(1911/1915/1917) synthase RluD [Proteobacteria bacterium]|nr:23S rRNA pseudouridine(1911/1915/1917) synthase RluD [Pseudomonadota bacterium]